MFMTPNFWFCAFAIWLLAIATSMDSVLPLPLFEILTVPPVLAALFWTGYGVKALVEWATRRPQPVEHSAR